MTTLIRGYALGVCVLLVQAAAGIVHAAEVSVTLRESTNMAATLSPNGRELIVDAQGVLWRLPVQGGTAKPLTDFTLEPARPEWSPVANKIVFQAYQAGTWDIWVMSADGSKQERLTGGPYDEREPTWSPDGTKIAFVSDRSGSYDIWSLDVASGQLRQWTSTPDLQEAYPDWSPDGTEIAYVGGTSIEAVNEQGVTRTLITYELGALRAPAWTPNGHNVVYLRQAPGNETHLMLGQREISTHEDVFPFKAQWINSNTLLYTADGQIRVRQLSSGSTRDIPFSADLTVERPDYARKHFDFDSRRSQPVKGIVTPALSPDGHTVAFVALNDLWLATHGWEEPENLTADTFYESDPAWSRDGKYLAYVSDRAGTPDIYIRDVATGSDEQLTDLDGAELYPAWSPSGSQLAFQDQTGATYVVNVSSGSVRKVLDSIFQPGRPTWSADGKKIALAAIVPYSARFREGTSQIRVVDVGTGEFIDVPPAPNKSLTTRSDDGPVWSPDGSAMAFIMDGFLWVAPVDNNGEISDDPVQITRELSYSPTWSGDSSKLLYLSNSGLKLINRDGGGALEFPVALNWHRQQVKGRRVIHAGKLWDGRSPELRSDVDIIVVGNRIKRITKHKDGLHGPDVIDASHLTVVPGLFEMHTHETWGLHTYGYGNKLGRLMLSFGITSSLSVGELTYRAIEDREALAAGARVGPRFFATGGPLDGDRIYYNAMRPITSQEQFKLELAQVGALDYDILKTYVRLRPAWMRRAAVAAHDRGIPVVSHFLSPGVLLGQDGTTHLGATERLDYSRIGSLTGRTYNDVIQLFAEAGMSVTTTFFLNEPSLYSAATDILDDPRVLTLLPSWEQRVLAAGATDVSDPANADAVDRIRDNPGVFAEILRRGGVVLAGTDSPLDTIAIGLHSNLRWLGNNDVTPFETLQTTTRLAAEWLGVGDDLGTVEPGKLADLSFVEGNPQAQVNDLINVRMVMKNGELFTLEDLMKPYQ